MESTSFQGNKKKPASEETGNLIGCRALDCRIQVARVPAPPMPDRCHMRSSIPFGDRRSGIKYSIVRPPVGSLPVLHNTIYDQVTNPHQFDGLKRIYMFHRISLNDQCLIPIPYLLMSANFIYKYSSIGGCVFIIMILVDPRMYRRIGIRSTQASREESSFVLA